jgi:predicted lipoprotein with Yx(FWY)xxD motif
MGRSLTALGLVVVIALAACGDDEEMKAEPPTQTSAAKAPHRETPSRPEPAGTEIVVAESQYGPILFSADRQAVYLFDKEASAKSECYGACAEAWPPVLADGVPQAGKGTESKLLGTTERDDGSIQVTYAGHPLYYYAHEGPGEVLCHNVSEFGGLWLVLESSGEAVS